MGVFEKLARKFRYIAVGKRGAAPRWADIKKFGLKRASRRRIRVDKKRESKLKL